MKKITPFVRRNITTQHEQSIVKLICLFVILILLPPVLMADSGGKMTTKPSSRTVAAMVNGQPIYKDQLEKRVRESMRNARGFSSNGEQITEASLRRALNSELGVELFYQGGQKLNIPDADEKIAAEVARLKAPLTDIQRQTYTDEVILEYAKRHFYVDEYMTHHDLIDPKVTEKEIRAYYEETKQGYAYKIPIVRVHHVLVNIEENASDEDKKLAREKIEKARQLLLSGSEFSDVAKEYSDDVEFPGGNFGFIEPGFMPANFEKVAFSLEIGKLSEVVETDSGFHVMEVLENRPIGSLPPYESLRAFFEKYLSDELQIKKVPAHARQLIKNAKIEILF